MILLALLVAASYPLVLLGLETFYYRDYGVLAYPTTYHHRESFWRGEVPLWNPLSHCGVPFLAQWGTMVLYPLSLIYTVLPLPWSLGVFCLGHLWLGGTGMFLLASRWIGHRFGAALGGLAYAFGGLTLSSLMWPNWTAALGWLPWVVFCGEQAGNRGGRWLVHACVIGTLQMLTGVPEVVLLTWFIVALLWALKAVQAPHELIRLFARGGLIIAMVSALSAAQLLPFLDLVGLSQRQTGFSDIRWSMPGWGWANLVVPLFHCFETPQGTFSQHEQAFFTSYYPGLFALALGITGCWRLKTTHQRVALVLLLAGLVLALGPNGYVYSWLRNLIPGVGLGRFPVKFFVLAAFALPVLAAYAAASLQSGSEGRKKQDWIILGLCAGGGLLAGGIILWFGRTHPFPFDQWDVTLRNFTVRAVALLAALALLWLASASKNATLRIFASLGVLTMAWLDLRFHWPTQNPTLPSSVLANRVTELIPPPKPLEARIFIAPWAGEQLLHSRVQDPVQDFLGKRLAMWSNLNLLEGTPNVGGALTLRLQHQEEVHKRILQMSDADRQPLLDYLAVSHTTASNNPVQWQIRPTALGWVTAGQRPLFLEAGSALEAITRPEFNPSATLVLPAAAAAHIQPQTTGGRWDLRTERVTAQHFRIRIDADQPTLVSLVQSDHAGWRATINGKPALIWRANHTFQAIQVTSGQSLVEIQYVDRGFQGGGISSILALGLCGLALRWWSF
jgi:hypothetical protein